MAAAPLTESFYNLHGSNPEWIIQAPGRIKLIGERIYCLKGFVMAAAIDRFLKMAVRTNARDQVGGWSSEKGTSTV